MVDKLTKALEGLTSIQFTTAIEDSALRKKEKMMSCVLVTDLMVSLKASTTQNFPQLISLVIENLINLCDDKEADVRMVADESLNRIIRALSDTNALKVQIELYQQIKKNGPARSLRAALMRFSQMSHLIRPNKGRAHVQALLPCLLMISRRQEESIHETTAMCLPNIFKVLGSFTNDSDVKNLVKAYVSNLSSPNAAIRRSAASCIVTIVQNSRKPQFSSSFLLGTLLELLVPVAEDTPTYLILGVLGCLRMLLPCLTCGKSDAGIAGSFGLRRRQDETLLSVDRLIQTYEVCLHYTLHVDHNVVTAALETLNQLLQTPPKPLEEVLVSSSGITRSYIHSTKEGKLSARSMSERSVACSLSACDDTCLLEDSDIPSPFTSITETDPLGLGSARSRFNFSEEDVRVMSSPSHGGSTGDSDSELESATPDLLVGIPLAQVKSPVDEEDGLLSSRTASKDDLLSLLQASEPDSSVQDVEVGSFNDADMPLLYCARHLVSAFLLDVTAHCESTTPPPPSLKSDRSVRVSVKSLVLSCLSHLVRLHHRVFFTSVAKSGGCSISDVLLFSQHSDPQIRGGICVLIGSFIQAAILESHSCHCDWSTTKYSILDWSNLIGILVQGLKDESSVCCRLALSALSSCLPSLLSSEYNQHAVPVLDYLPDMATHSYWLVKVKLMTLLGELPYVHIAHSTKSSQFQTDVMDKVAVRLLGDEDSRVRSAVAQSLVKMVPSLYYGYCPVLHCTAEFAMTLKESMESKKQVPRQHLTSTPSFACLSQTPHYHTEESLSRVVHKLSQLLLVFNDKFAVFGYVEALECLSVRFHPVVYQKAWLCRPLNDNVINSALLQTLLALVVTSPSLMDLNALSSATVLLTNLFAGHCVASLKNGGQLSVSSPAEGGPVLWRMFKNSQISAVAEQLLTHLLKVLNIYSHLLDEVPLSKSVYLATTESTLLPLTLPSPIKKTDKKSDKEEKGEDRKHKNWSTHYVKLYHLLKNAYSNYKISLEPGVSDKLLTLLEVTLEGLSTVLEVATSTETGRVAEEMLWYLRQAVVHCPTPAITCVIFLHRSLFGVSLACTWGSWEESAPVGGASCTPVNSIFTHVYQLPSSLLADRLRQQVKSGNLESECLSNTRRRGDWKSVLQHADKQYLTTYIRLLEPMVIKALRLYTVTRDVELQSVVLRLLSQLVQLRVNYCLLDADETFVGFVLKQFDLIEHGQIPNVEVLLPDMFRFLALLSYEKHNSKSIMNVPKLIQLCDGLMACDQSTLTHCIPALGPVVEDMLVSRSLVTSSEQKELETQREVLLVMLLRLAEFHQVMHMLCLVLNDSRTVEERERWKRWSRQVMDAILPLASQGRLRIETEDGRQALSNLMSSLSPNVLRPIDPLLRVLLTEPPDSKCLVDLSRWLALVIVILETLVHVKEDVLLTRLEEVPLCVDLTSWLPGRPPGSPDPFNVKTTLQAFEPAEALARFLVKAMTVVVSTVLGKTDQSQQQHLHNLQQQLHVFMVQVFHLFESGTFHRVSKALQSLLLLNESPSRLVNSLFLKLVNVCPMLTNQYCYLLSLVGYSGQDFWDTPLSVSHPPTTLSAELVRHCAVLSLADYLCENLSDVETLRYLLLSNIQQVVLLSNETPVRELLSSLQRRPSECNLLLQVISARCTDLSDCRFVEKLLRILETAESAHCGSLVNLVVRRFLVSPQVALSRLASAVACRRVEYLLTLPNKMALEQIDKDVFVEIISFMEDRRMSRRHGALLGLLNKLGARVFDLSPVEWSSQNTVNPVHLKNVQLDKHWFIMHVKKRCCQESYPGMVMAHLLDKLDYDSILNIMSSKDFNLRTVEDCLLLARNQRCGKPCKTDLMKASKECVLNLVKGVKKLLPHRDTDNPSKYRHRINELIAEEYFYSMLWKLAPCVRLLMGLHSSGAIGEIPDSNVDGIMKFGIVCLEFVSLLTESKERTLSRHVVEEGVACSAAIVQFQPVARLLSQPCQNAWLGAATLHSLSVLRQLAPRCQFLKITDTTLPDLQLLLKFLLLFPSTRDLLPSYLRHALRELVLAVCRIPECISLLLKSSDTSEVQDLEMLEDLVARFSVLGWTNRQQFEEMWVGLLTVLGFNTQGATHPEETAFIVQASATAVEGITALLKDTWLDPEPGNTTCEQLLQYGRDTCAMKLHVEDVPQPVCRRNRSQPLAHYFTDLEATVNSTRYRPGQLSVKYLWTSTKHIDLSLEPHARHTQQLLTVGVDLSSCVHLLIELFSQWVLQGVPDVRLMSASLKSAVVISDLYTDLGQYQWLLDMCLRVEQLVIPEDITLLPLLLLGASKAAAVTLPDIETCEKVKKLMLRSDSPACKVATLRGLLYLLQAPVVLSGTRPLLEDTTEDLSINVTDMFLPIALDCVLQFKTGSTTRSEDYERCAWAVVFYLLQHYQKQLGDTRKELTDMVLTALRHRHCTDPVLDTLVRGVERLLLTCVVDEEFLDKVTKLSLGMVQQSGTVTSQHGLQLLMTLSYLEKKRKLIRQGVTGQQDAAQDPEMMMKAMEKINALFEKLKKSGPEEAELVGDVIAYHLEDYDAAEVLSKVIQELLSPQEPHHKVTSLLLFKVFERADVTLLQDWILFSLPSFTQGLTPAMTIWTLSCFFVSVSTQPWLRALFHSVQARLGRTDAQDRKLLCLAALGFYTQLKDDKQRQTLLTTVERAAKTNPVFNDILLALQ